LKNFLKEIQQLSLVQTMDTEDANARPLNTVRIVPHPAPEIKQNLTLTFLDVNALEYQLVPLSQIVPAQLVPQPTGQIILATTLAMLQKENLEKMPRPNVQHAQKPKFGTQQIKFV